VPTLAAWGQTRIAAAMRAWRHGCGPLLPWFRATPFAAAHHYRDRSLPIPARVPAHLVDDGRGVLGRLASARSRPSPAALWIFDVPASLGLVLADALRRRWRLASALCFNGWYDPRGVLDGRTEIPLLLALGARRSSPPPARGVCLYFDSDRRREVPEAEVASLLDNRYQLGEEDAPAVGEIRAAGWRRIVAHVAGAPAKDLLAYLEYLERDFPVTIVRLGLGGDSRG